VKNAFFLMLLTCLFGCKGCDEGVGPNTKPEPTTDGRNTFYCEINGKPFYQKFRGGQPYFPKLIGSADSSTNLVAIDFRAEYDEDVLLFRTNGVVVRGEYRIDSAKGSVWARYYKSGGCDYFNAHWYNSMTGKVIFTRFDFRKRIFSGTFNFKNWLPDSLSNGCDTVRVTNGIFDLTL